MGLNQASYKSDPNIEVKRVRFLPQNQNDRVQAGYIVCYKLDNGTEGEQPYNRFYEVEQPSVSNINVLAGVVAADSAGSRYGQEIDIIPFDQGAAVPVLANANCTKGTTILFANAGSYIASTMATNSNRIGVCLETVDRSTTSGTVLVQYSPASGTTGGGAVFNGIGANEMIAINASGDPYEVGMLDDPVTGRIISDKDIEVPSGTVYIGPLTPVSSAVKAMHVRADATGETGVVLAQLYNETTGFEEAFVYTSEAPETIELNDPLGTATSNTARFTMATTADELIYLVSVPTTDISQTIPFTINIRTQSHSGPIIFSAADDLTTDATGRASVNLRTDHNPLLLNNNTTLYIDIDCDNMVGEQVNPTTFRPNIRITRLVITEENVQTIRTAVTTNTNITATSANWNDYKNRTVVATNTTGAIGFTVGSGVAAVGDKITLKHFGGTGSVSFSQTSGFIDGTSSVGVGNNSAITFECVAGNTWRQVAEFEATMNANGVTSWKEPVRAATTTNITLSGTQTVDGVALVANDRVLVKDQTTGSQNGIYRVNAGSWTRTTDADSDAEVVSGIATIVTEGTTNGDAIFILSTNDPITLLTTSLTFDRIGTMNDGVVNSITSSISGSDATITLGRSMSLPNLSTTFSITDPDAIHDNVASEISAVAAKSSPTTSDFLLIEDAADSNNKKRITIGSLPSGEQAPQRAIIDYTSEIQVTTESARNTYVNAIARMNVQGIGSNVRFLLPALGHTRPSWLQPGDTFIVRDNNASTHASRAGALIQVRFTGDRLSMENSGSPGNLTTQRLGQTYEIIAPNRGSRTWNVRDITTMSQNEQQEIMSTTNQLWVDGDNESAFRQGNVTIAQTSEFTTDAVRLHVTANSLTGDLLSLTFDNERSMFEFWGTYDSAMPGITASEADGIDDSSARTYFDNNVRTATQAAVPKLAIPNPDPDAQAVITGISFHSAGQVQIGYQENSKLEAGTVVGGYVRVAGTGTMHDGIWEIAPGGIDEGANTIIALNPASTSSSQNISGPNAAWTVTNVIWGWKTDTAISTTAPFIVAMNLYAANDVNTAYPALQSYWFDPDTDITSLTNGNALNIGYQDFLMTDSILRLNNRQVSAQDGYIDVTRADSTVDRYFPNRSQVDLLDVNNSAGTYNASTNPYPITNTNPHINVISSGNGDLRVNLPTPNSFSDGLYRYTIRADSRNADTTDTVLLGMVGNVASDNGFVGFGIAGGEIAHVEVTVSDEGTEIGWRVVETISRSKSSGFVPIDTGFTTFTAANINPLTVATSESDQSQDQDSGNTVLTVGGASGQPNENRFQMDAFGRYRLRYQLEVRFDGTQPAGTHAALATITPRLDGALLESEKVDERVFLIHEAGQDGYTAQLVLDFDYVNYTRDQRLSIDIQLSDIPTGFTFADFSYRRYKWQFTYTSEA